MSYFLIRMHMIASVASLQWSRVFRSLLRGPRQNSRVRVRMQKKRHDNIDPVANPSLEQSCMRFEMFTIRTRSRALVDSPQLTWLVSQTDTNGQTTVRTFKALKLRPWIRPWIVLFMLEPKCWALTVHCEQRFTGRGRSGSCFPTEKAPK